MTQRIIMGRIGSTQGIHGWLKITSYTTPKSNIFDYPVWQVQRGQEWSELCLQGKKTQGDTLLVKLPTCDTPEAAKTWTNTLIAVSRNELPSLQPDEFYWNDLVGSHIVTTDGIDLGTVKKILETGANDVFVTQGDKRHLIPYTDEVVIGIDTDNKLITVNWDPDF
jgi:16S rRNA processing protein RimM